MIQLSRGPTIDRDFVVEKCGGQYNMVLIVAARARQLEQQGNDNRVIHSRAIVTALLEIQNGELN